MPISSRALKEARFNTLVKRRKKKEQEIEDLSVLPFIDPNYYNLGTSIPIEEIGDLEPLEQNTPDTEDELITNLEDQILSKIDEESDELAPTPFNNNIADTVNEPYEYRLNANTEIETFVLNKPYLTMDSSVHTITFICDGTDWYQI